MPAKDDKMIRQEKLESYIRDCADVMGLKDWVIETVWGVDAQDSYAEIEIPDGKRAMIGFRAEWSGWDADRLRMVVVHELVHCHTHGMRTIAWNAVDAETDAPRHRLIQSLYDIEMEVAIDGIARSWAKFLPLPDFVTGSV